MTVDEANSPRMMPGGQTILGLGHGPAVDVGIQVPDATRVGEHSETTDGQWPNCFGMQGPKNRTRA